MNSERLLIRKFNKDDWKDLYEYLSVPKVVEFEPYNVFTEEECINGAIERSNENSPFFAVCLNEKMIGHIFFCQIDNPDFKTYMIGYVFNPKYYGNGYATESVNRMLKYAFEELNAHRVVAYCNVNNITSWRLLERVKMRRESHMLKNVYFKTNNQGEPLWNDSYGYAMLNSEWVNISN